MSRFDRLIGLIQSLTLDPAPARALIGSILDHEPSDAPFEVGGHRRAHYGPMLMHAGRRWPEFGPRLGGWLAHIESSLVGELLPEHPIPAIDGARIALRAWQALAVWSGSRAGGLSTDVPGRLFQAIARQQTPSGALLAAGPSDNPETWWHHELVLLHALASYAIESDDRAVFPALERAARFHLHETQPDHATTQPWAIHAFAILPETSMLADQMLHAMSIQGAGRVDVVSFVLLADALYSLEQLKRRTP